MLVIIFLEVGSGGEEEVMKEGVDATGLAGKSQSLNLVWGESIL